MYKARKRRCAQQDGSQLLVFLSCRDMMRIHGRSCVNYSSKGESTWLFFCLFVMHISGTSKVDAKYMISNLLMQQATGTFLASPRAHVHHRRDHKASLQRHTIACMCSKRLSSCIFTMCTCSPQATQGTATCHCTHCERTSFF